MVPYRSSVVAAALILSAGHGAMAQTAAPTQYVVTYGELAPSFEAQLRGTLLLSELARLAKADGAQYFSVNREIERPNLFTLVQVWSSPASYATFTGASNVQQVLSYLQPLLIAPLDERDGNLVTQ